MKTLFQKFGRKITKGGGFNIMGVVLSDPRVASPPKSDPSGFFWEFSGGIRARDHHHSPLPPEELDIIIF